SSSATGPGGAGGGGSRTARGVSATSGGANIHQEPVHIAAGADQYCDKATNRLKFPTLYAPPCVPAWSGGNGGNTYNGVTKDTITVAIPYNQTSATQTAALAQDTDSHQQRIDTRNMYNVLFNHHYQTYG